jgi:hypothetical protein
MCSDTIIFHMCWYRVLVNQRFVFWIWVKCLYNKQNNTWTLGHMNVSSCVQARYLTLLRSLVRYRAGTLEDKFHISARPCKLIIIFYLLAYWWLSWTYQIEQFKSLSKLERANSVFVHLSMIQISHTFNPYVYYWQIKLHSFVEIWLWTEVSEAPDTKPTFPQNIRTYYANAVDFLGYQTPPYHRKSTMITKMFLCTITL